ncbi:phage holin family protein [Limnobacter sp.]|uniref:phage holin family protein n=1 Tax=Limnobacter sp. TaxID=2003368 RepID=UPI00351580B8
MSSQAQSALKRVMASLLGMGQTRLELAGVELAQARQATVRTVVWSILLALAAALASVFACLAVVAWFWETHRMAALMGCVLFYLGLAAWFLVRLKQALAEQPPLFEATLAELGKDRQAILESIQPVAGKGDS